MTFFFFAVVCLNWGVQELFFSPNSQPTNSLSLLCVCINPAITEVQTRPSTVIILIFSTLAGDPELLLDPLWVVDGAGAFWDRQRDLGNDLQQPQKPPGNH